MELELGLPLSTSLAKGRFDFDLNQDYETNDRKYRIDQLGKNMNASFLMKRKIGMKDDEFVIIGWPPVKSRRNQSYRKNRGGHPTNYVNVRNSGSGGGGDGDGSTSSFVKVKMEGNGIARKIDLSLHHSYQTLLPKLIGMFEKCREDVGKYNLMYQDMDGDWLLAGNVPWVTLVNSVRRLKMIKIID